MLFRSSGLMKKRRLPRLPYQLLPFSQKRRVGISMGFNVMRLLFPYYARKRPGCKEDAPMAAAVIVWYVALPHPLL